ncbi:TLP18.3, Psb32 and MOLO-1 founding protein of phosphatase [Mariniphaga anaerophila]|uniref:TLP18.3, Psb32 and MOLO-1 founding protein of phosphatase n=1 Tax=Mariniphaga anaerophila TaxID=1484053 RepID=A0A1M4Y1U4_9BACT|nr:TPM domain-containing protein [Mariniphaga anaerophila]SHE99807.1 TLP18.3, Psb32 and MOLO-1 founding protein of phosphatase [Mariniphaga anaerophila]
MSVRKYFSEEDKLKITNAIRVAETNTSGEIRVHIEKNCKGNVLDRAAYIFEKLEMHKTQLRNGVLFYLAVADHKFAILGDAGINQKVPDSFWEEIKNEMALKFKEGNFTDGISVGIKKAGEQLKQHFPYQKDDVNELSDEISFGTDKEEK